jgi:hypothetical protein
MVLWQPTHSVGVFLKRPLTWQLAQRTVTCVPVSGNPVEKWLNGAVNADCAQAGATTSSIAAAMAVNLRTNDLNKIDTIYLPPPLANRRSFQGPDDLREN